MTKLNRANLLAGVAMTAIERSKGRFMRAPEHTDYEAFSTPSGDPASGAGNPGGGSAAGADSGAGGGNGGNSGESGSGSEGGDNTGQPGADARFWEPKPEVDTAGAESDQAASTALGQELSGMIQSFAPAPAFTKETAEKIAAGDLDGVNQAFQAQHQAVLKQSVVATAKIVETMLARQEANFEARIQKALGNKDNEVALESHFPAAKDPAYRPIVQRVFDQALVNSKGDRNKAIEQTKGMLAAFGNASGLTTPPGDPSSRALESRSKSLVDELLGR